MMNNSVDKDMLSNADIQTFNHYRNLRQIKRCNNLLTIVPEDVAQHSFYVALLAHKLAYEYNSVVAQHNLQYHQLDDENSVCPVQVKDCVVQALFHDLDTVFIGDISWDMKHDNPQLCDEIQNVLKQKLQKAYEKCNYINKDMDLILIARNGIAGLIVDLADMLEGAWYCCEEVRLGNITLKPLLEKHLELIQQSVVHKWLLGYDGNYKSQFYMEFMEYLMSVALQSF